MRIRELIGYLAFTDEYIKATNFVQRVHETQERIKKDLVCGNRINKNLESLRNLIDIFRLKIIRNYSRNHLIYLYTGIHSLEEAIVNKSMLEKNKLYIDKMVFTILSINKEEGED